MELTRRYRVTGVPKTIVNGGRSEVLGAVPEDAFVQAVVSGAGPEAGGLAP